VTLEDIARERDVPLRMLVALRAVESAGQPSAVRFEPHLFQRHRAELVRQIPRDTGAVEAARMRVSIRAQGLIPYTPGHDHTGKPRAASSSSDETDREAFDFARHLDAKTAIESTSFGLYQILGPTLLALGYADPVARFDAAPTDVSNAMLGRYLGGRPPLMIAMRAGDERRVVSLYNGCALERDEVGRVCGDGGCAGYLSRFRRALAAFDAGTISGA